MESFFKRKVFRAKDSLPDLLRVSFSMLSYLNDFKPDMCIPIMGIEKTYSYNYVVGVIAVIHELGHAYKNRWSSGLHQFEVCLAGSNRAVEARIDYGDQALLDKLTPSQICTVAVGWGRLWMSTGDMEVFDRHRGQ